MGRANTNPMTCSIDSKTIEPNTRLYPHQIEEWECLFSARSGGTNVHTLWTTWRGRTISVSTNLYFYKKNFSEREFKQIRDTGLHDVTFEIRLISGGRV